MEDHSELRQATLAWLRQAHCLPPIPQAITDIALTTQLEDEWQNLSNAVVSAASRTEHRDLYVKTDGDWIPSHRALLGHSGLGDATRLIAQGARVPEAEVADRFVAFCVGPLPASEDWLLLNADVPLGTCIPLGPYTLQTFTPGELRQMLPMPAIHDLQPGKLDLGPLAGAPFIHAHHPERKSTRGTRWFGAHGPRPEAQHWRALLPLILWDCEPLRVEAVFDVERGRRFGLRPAEVPTTIKTYGYGGDEEEVEVRDAGTFHGDPAELPAFKAFCMAVTARIEAVMDGETSNGVRKLRARRLERAARHMLRAYQRTFSNYGVWPEEVDELHLDYVIALEALLASPKASHDKITTEFTARASALFLTSHARERARTAAAAAYKARSTYVHGDVIKGPPGLEDKKERHKDQARWEQERLDELHQLRQFTLRVILRWLVLTPSNHTDLWKLVDAAEDDHGRVVGDPLRAFFTATPPRKLPPDVPR
ncbi:MULTISPECIES: hypothetical protein [unclassified Streptomyces]|uniref:hypothetical protein n=1 Tax=unclassified Streptomyces TaxID=2593676 RepID=UPI002DD8D21D|nr:MULTISPECIES: hypothetical protein [unclassified Streptomyces]WSF81768.1 HEPN domain-containing protein [Streptomyces sp. NBC_01744]WSC34135.1 HEPN domain-containing protein [Streptomyces sp. NBC_01763]WSC41923.1 HEPN domain-containing protein [Streptomyces sp. NBC_01763]WSC50933.1 HEPN domain-containing protein [Streptomyces sp. NBC_01761]WSC58588.1 HEPN domain-containing protein [Streptomyces sp. NBC_01761]